jgi:hypothetical protein
MPILFNRLLEDEGLSIKDVRLLRHQDGRMDKGLSTYSLWYNKIDEFELYKSHQSTEDLKKLNAPYWASFVATPDNKTLFVGLYKAEYKGRLKKDTPMPGGRIVKAETFDVYTIVLDSKLNDFIGKLFIEWGDGYRAWIQRPDKQNKAVIELRNNLQEQQFPGFLNFIKKLSEIDTLPSGWITALKNTKGIYLLTCPRTKEQYVGKADGLEGFWQRWQDYAKTNHGNNVALKSRDASDYQVSILEVAGTAASSADIQSMEDRWKSKLQSREMGLNRN